MLKLLGGGIHDALFSSTAQLLYFESMSTAMVRIYTPKGFVVAADGYPSGSDQKIYPANGPTYSLAYGFVGWAGLHDDETGWHISWSDESQQIAAKLANLSIDDMGKYAKTFARMTGQHITEKIVQLRNDGTISEDGYAMLKAQPTDCSIHFAGYFKGVPKMVVAQIDFVFPESSARLADSPKDCEPYDHFLFGSAKIRELVTTATEPIMGESEEVLRAKKSIWQKYRTPNLVSLIQKHEISMEQAAQAATDYIEACKDREAIKIDRKACEEIAGNVHVAKVTPTNGFEWMVQPKTAA